MLNFTSSHTDPLHSYIEEDGKLKLNRLPFEHIQFQFSLFLISSLPPPTRRDTWSFVVSGDLATWPLVLPAVRYDSPLMEFDYTLPAQSLYFPFSISYQGYCGNGQCIQVSFIIFSIIHFLGMMPTIIHIHWSTMNWRHLRSSGSIYWMAWQPWRYLKST